MNIYGDFLNHEKKIDIYIWILYINTTIKQQDELQV